MADMTYRPLGSSGLMVSTVGIGCNAFSRRVDLDGTRAIVRAALDAGVTLFDTADIYGIEPGASEAMLGEALGADRQDVIVATKFGMDMRGANFLLEDPLRTKVQSFDLLSNKEQLEWIVRAKEGLQNKLRELDSYADIASVPFKDEVHDNAVSSIRCRMEWLDRLLASIVRRSDQDWKRRLNRLILDNQLEIDHILEEYGVPLLDEHGRLKTP